MRFQLRNIVFWHSAMPDLLRNSGEFLSDLDLLLMSYAKGTMSVRPSACNVGELRCDHPVQQMVEMGT